MPLQLVGLRLCILVGIKAAGVEGRLLLDRDASLLVKMFIHGGKAE